MAYLLLVLHQFSGLFSGTIWVSWYQKAEPFWILMKQEMVGWHWHQLDHMQIICTSLQTDNHTVHTSMSSVNQFLWAGCSSCCPTNSVKALKEIDGIVVHVILCYNILFIRLVPDKIQEGCKMVVCVCVCGR